MSRKDLRPRKRRKNLTTDSQYGSLVLAKFINKLNYAGKKSTAEKVMYGAMDIIKEKTGEDPLVVFNKAIGNVRPLLEVRPRRVGGATYQVPMEVPEARSITLAFRWILDHARSRKGQSMAASLSQELIEASRKEGAAMKKRDDTHRMAEANKAFAHYKW